MIFLFYFSRRTSQSPIPVPVRKAEYDTMESRRSQSPQPVPVHMQPPLVSGSSPSPFQADSLLRVYQTESPRPVSPGVGQGGQNVEYGAASARAQQAYYEQAQAGTTSVANYGQPISSEFVVQQNQSPAMSQQV